jgi:urate oxidase
MDMEVRIMLEGDVSKSWLTGENSQIVPTETQKNTCYALALKTDFDAIEDYGLALGRDMLRRHRHLRTVRLEISERTWQRVPVQLPSRAAGSAASGPANHTVADGAQRHNHAFMSSPSPLRRTCRLILRRGQPASVTSGVTGVKLMKTTQSGFDGFIRDEYTNLQPTGAGTASPDRILCTELVAEWTYRAGGAPEGNFRAENAKAWQAMLNRWAGPPGEGIFSPSLQRTTYRMAEEALAQCPAVEEVYLFTPNVHFYTYPLQQFGMKNPNIVFQSTDCHTTASGVITTRLRRSGTRSRL